jgi:hypothetical protein
MYAKFVMAQTGDIRVDPELAASRKAWIVEFSVWRFRDMIRGAFVAVAVFIQRFLLLHCRGAA